MGLPGAGKTTLAQELKKRMETDLYTVDWFNADAVHSISATKIRKDMGIE